MTLQCKECGSWRLEGETLQCQDCGTMASPRFHAAPKAEDETGPYLLIDGYEPKMLDGVQTVDVKLFNLGTDASAPRVEFSSDTLRLDRRRCPDCTPGDRHQSFETSYAFSLAESRHGKHEMRVSVMVHESGGTARAMEGRFKLLVLPNWDKSDVKDWFFPGMKLSFRNNTGIIDARDSGFEHVEFDENRGIMDFQRIQSSLRNGSLSLSEMGWKVLLRERREQAKHQCPAVAGSIDCGRGAATRYLRLFALDAFILGRFEEEFPEADVLLAAFAGGTPRITGPRTSRISGRHARVSRESGHWVIEDLSRYGTELDGQLLRGKVPLLPSRKILLTHTLPGILALEVIAAAPHALYLARADEGRSWEMFVLLAPGVRPGGKDGVKAVPADLPVFFHERGGFLIREPHGGDAPLISGEAIDAPGFQGAFETDAYPGFRLRGYQPGKAAPDQSA